MGVEMLISALKDLGRGRILLGEGEVERGILIYKEGNCGSWRVNLGL